ncbi:hypothetical protein [Aquimarina sp. I32.4]|uniref:hypothetical protein n=1 Tax=Aquimarina sp. I32.4 TaxID=2053903 RepID=UPI000CDED404|nr:hypothetical protein [Aquimarina sp. I32.4]
MKVKIEGFHGTSLENAKSIILNDFKLSRGHKEWLGDGVYFFIDGISNNPSSQAEKWSIAHSWNKIEKKYSYKRYSVIKCNIEVDNNNFLDLTTSDGVEVLDYIIEHHTSKMKEIGKKIDYIDGFVINFARKEDIISIDIAKGNFYIKFTKERINQINRRTPNCTICSIYNPEKAIISKELLLTKEIN